MKTIIVSLRDQFVWQGRAHRSFMVAILGLVAGTLPMISWLPRYLIFAISFLGVIIGIISLYWEGSSLNRRYRSFELVERNPVFGRKLPHDDDLPDCYQSSRGTILFDRKLNDDLRTQSDWCVGIRSRYRLPEELEEIAPYVLRRTSGGKWHFNGPCVRMAGDCRLDGSRIIPFQEACFFDHLCSNELMRWQPHLGAEVWDLRRKYLYDTDRRLIPLASSELANIVGVSTLAISADRQVLIVDQSSRNHSSQGLKAPSGSGSLEMRDQSDDLAAFVLNGANRELEEETGVTEDMIASSHLLGFGRWLERGAKPEFFGVTLLTGTAESVDRARRQVARSETQYTRDSVWMDLQNMIEADEDFTAVMSVPLGYGIRALNDALEQDPSLLDLSSTKE